MQRKETKKEESFDEKIYDGGLTPPRIGYTNGFLIKSGRRCGFSKFNIEPRDRVRLRYVTITFDSSPPPPPSSPKRKLVTQDIIIMSIKQPPTAWRVSHLWCNYVTADEFVHYLSIPPAWITYVRIVSNQPVIWFLESSKLPYRAPRRDKSRKSRGIFSSNPLRNRQQRRMNNRAKG